MAQTHRNDCSRSCVSLPTCSGTGREEGGTHGKAIGKIRGRTAVRAQDDVALVVKVLCDMSLPFLVLRRNRGQRVHLPAPPRLLGLLDFPPGRQQPYSTRNGKQRGVLRHWCPVRCTSSR
jgi:hypothetical protein